MLLKGLIIWAWIERLCHRDLENLQWTPGVRWNAMSPLHSQVFTLSLPANLTNCMLEECERSISAVCFSESTTESNLDFSDAQWQFAARVGCSGSTALILHLFNREEKPQIKLGFICLIKANSNEYTPLAFDFVNFWDLQRRYLNLKHVGSCYFREFKMLASCIRKSWHTHPDVWPNWCASSSCEAQGFVKSCSKHAEKTPAGHSSHWINRPSHFAQFLLCARSVHHPSQNWDCLCSADVLPAELDGNCPL